MFCYKLQVRGVGAGGIVSTAFCLLYKLYTLRLTRKQVNGLLQHTDSPYIRALGRYDYKKNIFISRYYIISFETFTVIWIDMNTIYCTGLTIVFILKLPIFRHQWSKCYCSRSRKKDFRWHFLYLNFKNYWNLLLTIHICI